MVRVDPLEVKADLLLLGFALAGIAESIWELKETVKVDSLEVETVTISLGVVLNDDVVGLAKNLLGATDVAELVSDKLSLTED